MNGQTDTSTGEQRGHRLHWTAGALPRRRQWAAFAVSTLAAALAVSLAGCGSSGSKAPGKRKLSAKEIEAQERAVDAFEMGAGKPPTARTMFALAMVLTANGNTGQAVGVLQNLLQRYPTYSPAYIALAEAYLAVDRTEEAIAVLKKGVAHAPNDPLLLNNLGMTYFLQGDYESSLDYFGRAAAAGPGEPKYACNQAAALGMLGRVVEAAELYRKHLRQSDVHENISILARARQVSPSEAPPSQAPSEPEAPAPQAKRPATGPSVSAVRPAPSLGANGS